MYAYIHAHLHPHTRAPTHAHTRTHAPTHAHACAHTHAHRYPINAPIAAYNAFFAYGVTRCSTTRRKRLKTAIFQPCPQWAHLSRPAMGKPWAHRYRPGKQWAHRSNGAPIHGRTNAKPRTCRGSCESLLGLKSASNG